MLEQVMSEAPIRSREPRKSSRLWLMLLVLPYAALCFPALYVRATPALFGFPFFYWYQFAWVVLTSGLLWVVYTKRRRPE
jgi:hypothetical protein